MTTALLPCDTLTSAAKVRLLTGDVYKSGRVVIILSSNLLTTVAAPSPPKCFVLSGDVNDFLGHFSLSLSLSPYSLS